MLEAVQQAIRLVTTFDPAVVEIARLSLEVTLTALLVSAVLGIPLGAWLALTPFRGRRILTALIYTGMGLPPVLVGLIVYLFLSRSGPFGSLGWLFSFQAMVVAQTIIATPLILGVTMSSVLAIPHELRLQLQSLGATHWQTTLAVLWEARLGVIVGLVAGFGSIISEVGAVMLVGGNIDGRTRVLTTAIVLETRQGHFDVALALGIILLALSFVSNFALVLLQHRTGAPS